MSRRDWRNQVFRLVVDEFDQLEVVCRAVVGLPIEVRFVLHKGRCGA